MDGQGRGVDNELAQLQSEIEYLRAELTKTRRLCKSRRTGRIITGSDAEKARIDCRPDATERVLEINQIAVQPPTKTA